MAPADVELEQQLKETGKQLSRPPDSVDELLPVLDQLEKLLLKVDQSPKKSMLDALKPSMKALIQDGLSKHSDTDVKVAVASCISEITRITAPDAPYTDEQMKDVFQLIVSSFEDLSDQSSRSYSKRASILETVSKVRSCVIMLDLECDDLIVKMFEHFLKSVRDHHLDTIYTSMESIMALVIEESEEISVELLKPLLASVKKDRKGVLPVAHKLGKEVLLKSAEKLKPYMKPALESLGESLDMYHKIVAAVCDGTTANFEDIDDNGSGVELANECRLEKGSANEKQQADESKVTPASSDQVDKVINKEDCPKEEVDPVVENRSAKSVMSNGVNVTVKGETSVDQESKKPEEDKSQESLSKEETDDSNADKLANEKLQTEKISEKSEEKTDTVMNAADLSDSSQVEGDKKVEKDDDVKESVTENEKDNDVKEPEKDNGVKELENESVEETENQNEKDNDVKESENEAVIPSETEKNKDTVQACSPKATESKPAATATASSPSQSTSVPDESSVQSEKKQVPQEDETASPMKTGSPTEETRVKNVGPPKDEGSTQEDASEAQKQEGKETITAKEEVKLADNVNKSEDGLAGSDSDAKPLKKSKSRSKSTKQSGKKSKQPAKKPDVGESDAKKPKQSGKNVDAKVEESDSDDMPLKKSVKKGEKSKVAIEEEQEHDSDDKPLKLSAKKSNSKKKDDGKKRASGKTVAEKDQAKSLSGDDEMDISPKSAKEEGTSTETPGTSAKRKRSTAKNEGSDTIKYDGSLVGTKVKVWWPDDKMFYEGYVSEFYPAKKRHKVSYVDGDEEKLNLRNERWEILQEFSMPVDKEQNNEDQSEEASPEMNKKKKSKTDSSASQEKTKDSAKRVGGVSSSGKSKASTPKTGGKSSDPAATTSKEAGKSKEEEESPKTSAKAKTVNKSKGKTPPSGGKSNTNGPTKANVKEPEDAKSTENTKGGSKGGRKRRKA